jgi:ankyrin repeat protein
VAELWKKDFHSAIANKNADAMRRAIASGLPLNERVLGFKNEFTPLHYAVDQGGGPTVVEDLIAAGADVNAPVIQKTRNEKPRSFWRRVEGIYRL